MTFAARIRRVRMKDGADVHVLRNPMPDDWDGAAENFRGTMVRHAKQIAGNPDKLDGFVVIGLFADGSSSVGYRLPQRIGEALAASYVGELIRRDTVIEREAARVFDRKFEWRDA